MRLRNLLFGLSLGLLGCAEFPEVDAALSPDLAQAAYPRLLPFEDILVADAPRVQASEARDLRARARGLRQRAAGLRRPVIDRAARQRMARGVARF